MIASISTFIVGIIITGCGYWIVGKRKQGFATVCLVLAFVLIFSWTRFILDPAGLRILLVCLLVTLCGAALHSALIRFRSQKDSTNWNKGLLFAGGYFIVALLLFSNRGTVLGYETYRLPAGSMAQTLLRGDYIVVDTWRYQDTEPANGDIVVFRIPQSGISYIKRIVGVPGDSVSLQGNQLARNGQIVSEPYAIYEGSGQAYQPIREQKIPPNLYLMLGDNRNNSKDSRHFGMVPRRNIVGRIAHIYYSSDDDVGIRLDRIPT